MFVPVAAEHGVRFETETEPWLPAIDADPHRLLQVLSNLFGNAMKFTPSEGCVTLATAEDLSGPDTVGARLIRFQVSDTGPGIPPEDLAHVFDWLWHSGRQGGGTGLGLAIAKAWWMPTPADSTSRADWGRAPGSGSPCP
jgi:signal transduction histidine kinase